MKTKTITSSSGEAINYYSISELAKLCSVKTDTQKKRFESWGFYYGDCLRYTLGYITLNGKEVAVKGCSEQMAIALKILCEKIPISQGKQIDNEFKKWFTRIMQQEHRLFLGAKDPIEIYNREFYIEREELERFLGIKIPRRS